MKQIARQLKSMTSGVCYFVGGYVRDKIMGIPSHDVDICIAGVKTYKELTAALEILVLKKIIKGFTSVHGGFPIHIVDTGSIKFELAMARKEKKIGMSRTDFECEVNNVTIEEDLMRRDFTINAIAQDVLSGKIIDPFSGELSIEQRILMPVGPAFMEDPLRVIRGARFCTKYNLDMSTLFMDYAYDMQKEATTISKERIGMELKKVMELSKPSKFFYVLDSVGWLSKVFPEIWSLKQLQQNPVFHPEGDVFKHTMLCIDAAKDPLTRIAMLFHDTGKAMTTVRKPNGVWTSPMHEVYSAEIARKVLGSLAYHNYRYISKVAVLCELHMIRGNLSHKGMKKAMRRLAHVGLVYDDLVKVFVADIEGRWGNPANEDFRESYAQRVYDEGILTPIVTAQMLIDELNLTPGPMFKKILDKTIEWQDKESLTKENWQQLVSQYIKQIEKT